MTTNYQTSYKNLGQALERLKDIMSVPLDQNDFVLDAAIQRFEFVTELFWKTLKHFLLLKGVETALPRDALQKAYAAGWLENETLWLHMMRDRNQTSHTYKHVLAIEIYQRVVSYVPELERSYEKIGEIFSQELKND
ncbi:MAG: Nucleotidyltransferase substrate binding protein like protein [bacterium ADurb.BinA186]|nr:MAG: Nucleotidyltransferase substrate binding protein like protein [bacterium ADurb.BinA186]